MGKAIAIIIATAQDGTLSIVDGADGIKTRSQARARLPELKEEGFAKVELFDLRSPNKRRKFSRSRPSEFAAGGYVPPSVDEMVQKLFEDPALLTDKEYGKDGIPNVKPLGKAFGISMTGPLRDEIWEKVQALKAGDMMAAGVGALAAILEMPVEELEATMELAGFPESEGTEEGSGEPLYDVEAVREFLSNQASTETQS